MFLYWFLPYESVFIYISIVYVWESNPYVRKKIEKEREKRERENAWSMGQKSDDSLLIKQINMMWANVYVFVEWEEAFLWYQKVNICIFFILRTNPSLRHWK